MDFNVSIGDSGSVMTESDATPTPAGLQAREEYAKVLSDPTHKHFEGLKRGDKHANEYVDGLYKQAYPTTLSHTPESVSIGGPVPTQPGETSEDAEIRARNEVILSPLKTDWGPQFETRFSGVRAVAQQLFGGEGWGEVFDDLGATIRMQYGPAGETAALRFLNALADIKHQQGGY